MAKLTAQQLLLKYQDGKATDGEKALVEHWLLHRMDIAPDLTDQELLEDLLEIRYRFNSSVDKKPSINKLWPLITVAASIVILITAVIFYNHPSSLTKPETSIAKNEILPGSNKAILTLANGKRIVLSDAVNGKLAEEGNSVILKNTDGTIVYNANNAMNANVALAYNSISTPRGGQYHLILADGTNVWLNAASSIRYPAVFRGLERKVEVTGEAYFEVVHNAAKPFRVVSGNQLVEVLGTHFNIHAYPDEDLAKTTLLEGSIKISRSGQNTLLKPGQQAQTWITDHQPEIRLIDHADTELAVAWKNGFFSFKDTELKEVMQQLARWYNVDIVYEGNMPDTRFSGKIHRNIDASKVLDILKFTKLNFRIEGKKIIVTP